jgi:hypothetical protein
MSSWKEDAEINRARLDEECSRMPVIFQRWSDYEQQACAAEDQAAHLLLVAEEGYKKSQAKAHLELRSWSTSRINRELKTELDPTKFPTEAVYKDLIQIHPDVIKAEEKLNAARIELIAAKAHRREMQSARYTMDIKDKALKKLVDIGDRMFGMSGSYRQRTMPRASKASTKLVQEHVLKRIR